MKRRTGVALLATLVLAAACGGNDDDAGRADTSGEGALETPTFAENEPAITRSPDTAVGASTTGPEGATTSPTTGPQRQSVSFDDPIGDATPGVGTSDPPPWTDLAGAALERQGDAFRLTIRLGGNAPTVAPGPETMNIASFFDVDDDSAVDYELWINLGEEGWGPVWYDDEGNAAPGERSNVTVVVEGNEVRLLFPDVMLDEPESLRFSVASEYGELSTIGSSAARRDDAPDDDRAVPFP